MPIRNDAGTVNFARTAAVSSLGYRRPSLVLLAFTVGRLPPPRLVVAIRWQIVGVALSFLCAAASYRHVEQPFLRCRQRHEQLHGTKTNVDAREGQRV